MSLPVMNEEELRNRWNTSASAFQQIEKTTVNIARTLFTFLKIHEVSTTSSANNPKKKLDVIEVGCGGGTASHNLLSSLRPDTTRFTLTLVDLASSMLEIAKNRLLSDNTLTTFLPCIRFIEANAEKLPFEDKSFDRLYSNYCIHLVENPDKALSEARRVLREGGVAAWSVWGRKENSPKFTVFSSVLQEFTQKTSKQMPNLRSSFHLSDISDLKRRVINAGFSRVIAWYQEDVSDFWNGTEYADIWLNLPFHQAIVAELSPDEAQMMRAELIRRIDDILASEQPIKNEVLIVVGFC